MPLLTMKQLMKDSRRLATTDSDPKERYAVGAFNFSTLPEMVGIVEGARMKHAPVILMASLGAVKYIGSLELIAECAKGLAKTYPEVPFCVHLDHAVDLDQIKRAIAAGFTNVMIDASKEPYEVNIQKSKEIAEFAHRYSPYGADGCSVEAELGMLAGREEHVQVSEEVHWRLPSEQHMDSIKRHRRSGLIFWMRSENVRTFHWYCMEAQAFRMRISVNVLRWE